MATRTNYCTNPASVGTKWGTDAAGFTLALEASPPVALPAGITSCTKVVHSSGAWQGNGQKALLPTMAVTPGESYTFSFYVHAAAIAGGDTIRLKGGTLLDGVDVRDNAVLVAVDAVNAGFVRISGSVTIAAGENQISSEFIMANGTGTYYVTGCLIEKSADLLPYFDGSYPHSLWLGIAHASTSVNGGGGSVIGSPIVHGMRV